MVVKIVCNIGGGHSQSEMLESSQPGQFFCLVPKAYFKSKNHLTRTNQSLSKTLN